MKQAAILLVALLLAAPAQAARDSFPNPDSGLRADTPDDPRFDCNEADDEDGSEAACGGLFDQQIQLFGFAPDATEDSAVYRACPPSLADCTAFATPQIAGVKADAAWKFGTGRPDVLINVTDTGIRWDRDQLRLKIFINAGELPLPQGAQQHDANGDGVFNVDDYAGDSRVQDSNENGLLDGQDLIRAFSDGVDDDGNGYVDDISGWDFLEDDNDPDDTSSYSSAANHGSGRAEEAAEQTNDGQGQAGVCPQCMVLVTRVWDTFVVPGDNWAGATAYAADMGAAVQVVANGVLNNSPSMKEATRYAHEKGMALMHVSSDLNTANHNYPTNYVESVYINGCVADAHGASTEFDVPGLADLGLGGGEIPILTWFRNSNLTQYGAHAHVCYTAVTGSEATGHAGGGAGLLVGLGRDHAEALGGPLSAYEIKQLLTLTAEDVLPENVDGIGIADPAQAGFDEFFGYGRADLGAAAAAVVAGDIPPEVLIREPAWWAMLDPVKQNSVSVRGRIAAPRSSSCQFRVEWAVGVSPEEDEFRSFTGLENLGCSQDLDGALFEFPLAPVADALPGSRDGENATDPNAFVFTVRVIAEDADGRRGEDRKTYFAYHDPSWHEGWPQFVDTGGETSPILYDLDGDGAQEYLDANSAGQLMVFRHDGELLPSFNDGQPWQLPPTFFHHPGAPAFASGEVSPLTSGLRSPSVADVDGDFEPEIVLVAGDGRVFVLSAEGEVERELGVDPALSTPDLRDRVNHPKRGAIGTAVLADLEKDGEMEIILAALDNHIYVWSGKTGALKPGFPKNLVAEVGSGELVARGELIATPAVGDLDGDGVLEIVSGSSDVIVAEPGFPSQIPDLQAGFGALVEAILDNSAGQSTRVYAVKADGTYLPGWPVRMTGLLADVLPLVGPQHAVSIADFDEDGRDEVVASMTTGDVHIFSGDGSARVLTSNGAINGGSETNPSPVDAGRILNLFEYTVIGDLDGLGGLDIAKGGVSAPAAVNLVLVGQNFPFNHVVQAWDSSLTESYLPGYPVATDDYQLLSTPAIGSVVDGAQHIITGTGLYLLHAYGPLGQEAEGFPKLTGGWLFNTPAIGDVDGDGLLELVAGTREGYRFIWDLSATATLEAVNQWPMEGHDPCHSNNYGMDCTPPAKVRNARWEGDELVFETSGDDGFIGQASSYMIRDSKQEVVIVSTEISCTTTPQGANCTQFNSGGEIRVTWKDRHENVEIYALDEADNRSRARLLEAPRRGGKSGALALPFIVILLGLARLGRRRRCAAF